MIIESLLLQLIGFLSVDSLFSDNNGTISDYISAFNDILTYLDYFDPIIPIPLLLSCAGILLVWTVTCFLFKFLLEVIKVAFK